jgi:hypothetical protein
MTARPCDWAVRGLSLNERDARNHSVVNRREKCCGMFVCFIAMLEVTFLTYALPG